MPKGGTAEGYTTHFVDRVTGQHSAAGAPAPPGGAHPGRGGMRRGVRIEDILDALENPVQVTEIAVDKSGLRSYIIFGTDCSLAVNPDTNGLIQVNPVH